MLPDNTLATTPITSPFLFPDSLPFQQLRDYEMGGQAISDPSKGLQVKAWTARLEPNGDVLVYPLNDDTNPTVVVNIGEANWLGLTFDRNMNVVLCWQKEPNSTSYLYWFDSVSGQYVTSDFLGIKCPRVSHDDKREEADTWDDVLFCYLTSDNRLAYRQQRERYEVERFLTGPLTPKQRYLTRVGMGLNMRLQFELSSWRGA